MNTNYALLTRRAQVLRLFNGARNRRRATPALFIEPFDALLKGAGVPADFGDVVGSAVQPHSKAPPGGGALLTDSYFKFNRLRMTQPDVLDADLLC
ncbi:hypothetical protein [Xanthomonas arboricola]|uniref:hypothetical protein n=1 Tax=Xanthomonas arboricola TaxID=56448 RepID=UPI0011AFDD59|nr:hypothetical protein [Xanthomonas arboricola]